MVEYKLFMCEFREYKNESYYGEDLTPKSSWRSDLGTFETLDETLAELKECVNSYIRLGAIVLNNTKDSYVLELNTSRYKAIRIYRYIEFNFEKYFTVGD